MWFFFCIFRTLGLMQDGEPWRRRRLPPSSWTFLRLLPRSGSYPVTAGRFPLPCWSEPLPTCAVRKARVSAHSPASHRCPVRWSGRGTRPGRNGGMYSFVVMIGADISQVYSTRSEFRKCIPELIKISRCITICKFLWCPTYQTQQKDHMESLFHMV